ncbi:NTP transferase domain-containing protein [Georgenia sp. 10Sc9-8]|uniref:NTP transferase domain-containing protein n=1 Tax=Georgenia halotolerans TaxID=3028317 RepID=A0ABT5TXF3_9MICO|nr:NTP transferase domain-containing protein [Georgenia halotolerans]
MTDRAAVPFDAVVLAGGTGSRLGGATKPEVVLRGRRLLDHALDATAGAGRVVVVAPETVAVPAGVLRTLEDPPHGGPVAGIAAGLATLSADGRTAAGLVLVLACDVPGAAGAAPALLTAAARAGSGTDGVCLRDPAGRDQWLSAVYRTAALRARLTALAENPGLRGAAVRRLVGPLVLAPVDAGRATTADVDTWADLAELERLDPPDGAGPPL